MEMPAYRMARAIWSVGIAVGAVDRVEPTRERHIDAHAERVHAVIASADL
jgi:hypothetical protein